MMVVGITSTRGESKQGRIPRNKIIHAAFRAGGRRVKGEEGEREDGGARFASI